jgi:hypothetical protein
VRALGKSLQVTFDRWREWARYQREFIIDGDVGHDYYGNFGASGRTKVSVVMSWEDVSRVVARLSSSTRSRAGPSLAWNLIALKIEPVPAGQIFSANVILVFICG